MNAVHGATAHKHKQLAKPHARECCALNRGGSFYGYNVSLADNINARLTVFLDVHHSFVRLQNRVREVDMVRGFYPGGLRLETAEGVRQCQPRKTVEYCDRQEDGTGLQCEYRPQPLNHIGAKSDRSDLFVESRAFIKKDNLALFMLSDKAILSLSNWVSWVRGSETIDTQGMVKNELDNYTQRRTVDSVPAVSFTLSDKEALEVENFILKRTEECGTDQSDCTYQLLGYNCMDFSQEVFEQTSYPGHFIGYFPANTLLMDRPLMSAYAALSHPVVPLAGHTALAALTVFWVIPKISSAISSIGGWLASLAGSTAAHKTVVDSEAVESRYRYVKACCRAYEQFWDSYADRNAVTHRLISDSTDLQFRFLNIKKRVEESLACGHTDTLPPHVCKELEKLEQGFRGLAKSMKNELRPA